MDGIYAIKHQLISQIDMKIQLQNIMIYLGIHLKKLYGKMLKVDSLLLKMRMVKVSKMKKTNKMYSTQEEYH
jgi:hypothetical protein